MYKNKYPIWKAARRRQKAIAPWSHFFTLEAISVFKGNKGKKYASPFHYGKMKKLFCFAVQIFQANSIINLRENILNKLLKHMFPNHITVSIG